MPRYDGSGYDPPAPLATVSLRESAGGRSIADVLLLIDTGADVTLLPRWAVTALGITPDGGAKYEVIGFDGTRSTAEAVELDMLFLNRAFRGRYLVSDEEHGILWRDVLASLRVIFDGRRWSGRKRRDHAGWENDDRVG